MPNQFYFLNKQQQILICELELVAVGVNEFLTVTAVALD